MTDKKPPEDPNNPREPVVLSDKEALYPPTSRAIKVTIVAVVALVIVAIALFIIQSL